MTPEVILLIDNFDSFTYMLADYFLRTGARVKVVRNDIALNDITTQEWSALVISPGPESPEKAGNLMSILAYYHDKLPILGICLGHQAIGTFFGAHLCQGNKPMHGKVSRIFRIQHHEILAEIPESFQVTRYHSLELKAVSEPLMVILKSAQGEIMGLAHRYLPIVGLQFHPEAHLTEYGEKLIRNWVACHVEKTAVGLMH